MDDSNKGNNDILINENKSFEEILHRIKVIIFNVLYVLHQEEDEDVMVSHYLLNVTKEFILSNYCGLSLNACFSILQESVSILEGRSIYFFCDQLL